MKTEHGTKVYILSAAVLALCACSHSLPFEPKKPETKPTPPRFSITTLDAGPLTRYAPRAKELTEAVPGTSVRRSFTILNDPASPVKISGFGLRMYDDPSSLYSTLYEHCTPEKQLADSFDCARLVYVLDWSFKAQSPVIAWEANSLAFDAMNRFLWANEFANGTRGKDATGLELGTEYKTDRIGWWSIGQTDNLGKWITSVVFMTSVRTKDGAVWLCDKEALKVQMRALSLDPSGLK